MSACPHCGRDWCEPEDHVEEVEAFDELTGPVEPADFESRPRSERLRGYARSLIRERCKKLGVRPPSDRELAGMHSGQVAELLAKIERGECAQERMFEEVVA